MHWVPDTEADHGEGYNKTTLVCGAVFLGQYASEITHNSETIYLTQDILTVQYTV